MPIPAAIACENLIKTYGNGSNLVHALRGVDMNIPSGHISMIVGPSGCGKTTLISILSTLSEADSGVCQIFGTDILTLSNDEKVLFRRSKIGFVFQAFNLIPALTAAENVAVPLILKGLDRQTALKQARIMLNATELSNRHQHYPAQLSGGQQQRVAIARALIHDPDLIICDEPTSALDHQAGQAVMKLLRNLTDQSGKTVLIVTHDSRIYEYADQLVSMEDGQVISMETPK